MVARTSPHVWSDENEKFLLDAALRLGFPLPLVGDSLWSQGRLLTDHAWYDWTEIRHAAKLIVDTQHVVGRE
jgi:hypothetical protein